MRGKVGLVLGLAAGYVLGARAGRQRYEQIAEQAHKLWELEPVQDGVAKVKTATTDAVKVVVLAVPKALWAGAVKVTEAVQHRGENG